MSARKLPACPSPGFEFASFNTWEEVRAHVSRSATVYYWAPLDTFPRSVAAKAYKNGKIRIDPLTTDADRFTADAEHLDRFFYIRLGDLT